MKKYFYMKSMRKIENLFEHLGKKRDNRHVFGMYNDKKELYLLKLKEKGVEPDEADFNKGGEINYYPMIRLNFSESLCNFLFEGDKSKEQEYLREWDQFIRS